MVGVDACQLKFMHTHLAKAAGMGKLHAAVGAMLIMLLALSTFTPIHRPVNSPIHASTSLLKPQTICFPKLAYFVAFGPHGPRTPANEPGHSLKVFVGVAALVGTAYAVFELIRSQGTSPFPSLDPPTLSISGLRCQSALVGVGRWSLVWNDLVTC